MGPNGVWTSKSQSNPVPWNVTENKYGALTGVKPGNPSKTHISVDNGVYDFIGWSCGALEMTENITYEVTALYEFTPKVNLTFQYIDNIANGSGSWATVQNTETSSFTHTFKVPADIPEHYNFLYWEGEGEQITAGTTKSVSFAELSADTTMTYVATYDYQPGVQVRYHYGDNESITDVMYEPIDIAAFAPITAAWYRMDNDELITSAAVPDKLSGITTPVSAEQAVVVVDVYAAFTVSWVNYDNNLLEQDVKVPYGSTPKFDGETPTRTGTKQTTYVFAGWSPTITPVTQDAIYTATYTSETKKDEVKSYLVGFLPGDHGTFQPQWTWVAYGGRTPTPPVTTGEDGYKFIGWDAPVGDIVYGSVVFTAQWEKIEVPTPVPSEPPQEDVIRVKIVEDIEDDGMPLAAPAVWALLNLILLVITIFTLIKRKKKYNIITPIAVLTALGLFIFTENIHNPMVIIDKWTVWQLLICIIGVGSRLIAKNEEEKQEEATN